MTSAKCSSAFSKWMLVAALLLAMLTGCATTPTSERPADRPDPLPPKPSAIMGPIEGPPPPKELTKLPGDEAAKAAVADYLSCMSWAGDLRLSRDGLIDFIDRLYNRKNIKESGRGD